MEIDRFLSYISGGLLHVRACSLCHMTMKNHDHHCNSSSSPPVPVQKVKPKIRVIHIFAPEIIKTDVENFRELVQRLTGKPTEKVMKRKTGKNSSRGQGENPHSLKGCSRGMKEEEDIMWNGENSGGFLNGLSEMDEFIQELGEFPMLPMAVDSSNLQYHGYEESQIS